MPFNINRIPDEASVREAMALGEGEQIEFKGAIPDPRVLGRMVSAFANTSGGWVLVGIRENPALINGCDYPRLTRVFDRVVQRTRPAAAGTLHRVTIDGLDIGVITVMPSKQIVTSEDGVFKRVDASTERITVPDVQARVAPAEQPQNEQLAEGLAILTETVESVRKELADSRKFKAQLPGLALSFVIGCITGVIGNYIFKALGN